jgi:hypothetical protein
VTQPALVRQPTPTALPALVAATGDNASIRFLEFFAAQVHRCAD